MFNLFKSNKKLPPFPFLASFPDKTRYFLRAASWMWTSESQIIAIDQHAPRIVTMDPWPQLIFLAAEGQKTIEEYVYHMAEQYIGKVPAKLDETIINEIQTLLKERMIVLSETKRRPDPNFDMPKKKDD
jgi:hypothetical protein